MKLIVAISKNNVIGKDGGLPWKCPEDMKHFRETTLDNCVVMGYNTYRSLGKPLKFRTNLVIDKAIDGSFTYNGFTFVEDYSNIIYIRNVLLGIGAKDNIFIIGGAKTYQRFLDLDVIDELIVTHINEEVEGDIFFDIPAEWQVIREKVLSERAVVKYYAKT